MLPDNEHGFEAGYGKPPRHTRFKKGQSGNPRGRPKGSKNLTTLLTEALNEPVIVAENGGRRKITMRQAIIKQLVNRSATADWRAIKILLDLVRDIEGQRPLPRPPPSARLTRRSSSSSGCGSRKRKSDVREPHPGGVPGLAAGNWLLERRDVGAPRRIDVSPVPGNYLGHIPNSHVIPRSLSQVYRAHNHTTLLRPPWKILTNDSAESPLTLGFL